MNPFLLALILLFMNAQALAAPQIDAHEAPYGIRGATASELREQMNLFRLQEAHGSYDADTQWNIKWNYDYQKNAANCELRQYQVNLEIIYHLPQWLNEEAADSKLRDKWENYMEHLRIHETGHARNGEKAAWEIDEMLYNFEPMPTCKELEQTVNDRARPILSEHNAWDVDYDKSSNHGMNQGAVFP